MNYKGRVRNAKKILNFLPDRVYLQLYYHAKFGKFCNLKNPETFNEKLQWLKLYDRRPEYTTMVDKYTAKQWVADRIGEEYIIPTLGVWDQFDEIDFDALPDQFVLKCTHDSGGLVIVRDKKALDREAAKKKLDACLRRNFYYAAREWPYKNVPPRIIAEKYMEEEHRTELDDYKVFNFNGEPKLIQVDHDRFVAHKKNLYSTDWEYINMSYNYPSDPAVEIAKPERLDEMLFLSRKLSKNMPFLRTDFYCIKGKIYFGELTLYPVGGFGIFDPDKWDYILGEQLHLPEKSNP